MARARARGERTERRLTIREAATRLGLHEQTVRKYIRAGLIRTFTTPSVSKFGVRHRILEVDLEKFVARQLRGNPRIDAPRIEDKAGGNGPDWTDEAPNNSDDRKGAD